MKVYISGPIKDTPDFELRFAHAEESLQFLNHETVNPCTIEHNHDGSYESFMREDIRAMLDCEAIFLLRGWERSAGAKLEFLVATMTGMAVMYE